MSSTHPATSIIIPNSNSDDEYASPNVQSQLRPTSTPAVQNQPSHPCTILSLPPELICRIFILLPSTTSILPLIETSKHFHRIWIGNAIRICRGRMGSSCWTFAEELAMLQSSKTQSQDEESPTSDGTHTTAKKTTAALPGDRGNKHQFAARLLQNDLIVNEACERFRKLLASGQCFPYWIRYSGPQSKEGEDGDAAASLTEMGKERFHGAYYRYWIERVRSNDNAIIDDEGRMKHEGLDLRTLFVRDVFLRKRR